MLVNLFDTDLLLIKFVMSSKAEFAKNLNYLCIRTGLADRAISKHGYSKIGRAVRFAMLYQEEVENGQNIMDGIDTALGIIEGRDPMKGINGDELRVMNEILYHLDWKYAGNLDFYLRPSSAKDMVATYLINQEMCPN